MKKSVLLIVVIFIGMFTSCKKEEVELLSELNSLKTKTEVVDTLSYQKLVSTLPVLTEKQIDALTNAQKAKNGVVLTSTEVSKILSELSGLKKAEFDNSKNIIIVRRLNSRQSIIRNDFVAGYYTITRFTGYMVIDEDKNVTELMTLSQTYEIKDGKVNESSFWFDFELDCPQNYPFALGKVMNVFNVKCFFIGDDGISFSYNLEVYNGNMINIIPFENGKCIVQGYNQTQGNSAKMFETTMFDCYQNITTLPLAVIIYSNSNIKSSVVINTSLLEGINTLVLKGEDQYGNSLFSFPDVLKTIQLSELSFVATFDIKTVRINGRYGTYEYNVTLIKKENGVSYYRLI